MCECACVCVRACVFAVRVNKYFTDSPPRSEWTSCSIIVSTKTMRETTSTQNWNSHLLNLPISLSHSLSLTHTHTQSNTYAKTDTHVNNILIPTPIFLYPPEGNPPLPLHRPFPLRSCSSHAQPHTLPPHSTYLPAWVLLHTDRWGGIQNVSGEGGGTERHGGGVGRAACDPIAKESVHLPGSMLDGIWSEVSGQISVAVYPK